MVRVLNVVALQLLKIPLHASPPEIGMAIYKIIYRVSKNSDPYREIKERYTENLLALYPQLQDKIISSKDSLYTALTFAALANAIDLGADHNFDFDKTISTFFHEDFEISEYSEFKKTLKTAKRILYIADNAGETVLDKLLIEQLNKPVIYAVRSNPIINDATIDDARHAGIDSIAEVISSGCDAPGTILKLCTTQFKEIFWSADMVISKGQGNYETLSDVDRPIFFLLQLKCPVVARNLRLKRRSTILILNKHDQ
jgi:uncharacterized protein with ATP-grasp and redox domains